MITQVKYTDLTSTQVRITLDDGREMFASVKGATWLHTELAGWMDYNEIDPFMTEEELAQKAIDDARMAFKSNRLPAVESIKVTVGDKVFDGDETSQTRMARAVVAMADDETVLWVLADNTPMQITKTELTEALRKAGEEQTRLWVYTPPVVEQLVEGR